MVDGPPDASGRRHIDAVQIDTFPSAGLDLCFLLKVGTKASMRVLKSRGVYESIVEAASSRCTTVPPYLHRAPPSCGSTILEGDAIAAGANSVGSAARELFRA